MTEHSVAHATFTLERTYPAAPDRVFAAWARPEAKARWFAGPDAEHELDFRVGGREVVRRPGREGSPELTFVTEYHDIVPGERIVYGSTLAGDGETVTVSLTTVVFAAAADGTRLVLTEQGVFLDGREQPAWREQGTSEWLDALAAELQADDKERNDPCP